MIYTSKKALVQFGLAETPKTPKYKETVEEESGT
jgi:hypothetical protein